jgi:hypothetical protein
VDDTLVLGDPTIEELTPSITANGLELYYIVLTKNKTDETRPMRGIHVSERKSPSEKFVFGRRLKELPDLPEGSGYPFIAPNGNTLYFVMAWKIWTATKVDGVFTQLKELAELTKDESWTYDLFPTVSSDEKTLFFASMRPSDPLGSSNPHIYWAHRDKLGDAFGDLVFSGNLNLKEITNQPLWVSPDGCRLYFSRGSTLLMVAHRPYLP